MSQKSQPRQPIRAALAAFIGTTIEFYDFYTYGFAAALVLGELFFPSENTFVSTMASFATFAVGFIARPLSGAFFGHLGDRLGRKKMLVLTMFLMGVATTCIGLLPPYSSIGILAPTMLILLRDVQGIAVGGEWGGGVLMASEHAPENRKTLFASFPQLGSPAGLLLTLAVFRLVTSLDHADFISWGWRVPFLASAILLVIGLFVRLGVNESPEFEELKQANQVVKSPVKQVLRTHWYPILLATAATTIASGGYFFTNTFMVSYVTTYLTVPKALILNCLFVVTVIQLISQPLSALISERIGETRFITIAAILAMFSPYPMFLLVNTRSPLAIVIGISIAVVLLGAIYSVLAGFMTKAFPTHLRYSGISISYQLCCALAGGTTPLIGSVIAEHYKNQWIPLAVFYSILSTISLAGIVGLARYISRITAHHTPPHVTAQAL